MDPVRCQPLGEVWYSIDVEQMLRDREIQLDMPMLPGPLPPEPPRVEPPRIGPWQTPVVRPPSGLGY